MNLDFSKFKKISSDDKKTILRHPKGHSITVAHASLSKKMRDELDALESPKKNIQHFSSGGMADSGGGDGQEEEMQQAPAPQIPMPQPGAPLQPQQQAPVVVNVNAAPQPGPAPGAPLQAPAPPQGQEQALAPPVGPVPAPIPQMQGAPMQEAQGAPMPIGPVPDQTGVMPQPQVPAPQMAGAPGMNMGPTNNYKAGLNQEAAALGAAGNEQAQVLGANSEALTKIGDAYTASRAAIDQDVQHSLDDVRNGHINPNHYWDTHSGTGQKVATFIGLVLGGLGGGLTGKENPVMQYLNGQVDKDIQAQQKDMDSKQNLLKYNMDRYGNLNDATNMARAMQLSLASDQLKMAEAKSQDPIAKARARMASAQIDMQVNNLKDQVAQSQAKAAAIGDIKDPAAAIAALVPKEHQKVAFEELARRENISKNAQNILRSFDQASGEFKGVPMMDRSGVKAFHQLLLPNFKSVDGTVRQAAMDETFHNLTPQFGDTAATLKDKRRGVEEWMRSESSAPTARGYGVDLDKFQSSTTDPYTRLDPQQKKYADWAKANPKDPKSSLVLKKLGLL